MNVYISTKSMNLREKHWDFEELKKQEMARTTSFLLCTLVLFGTLALIQVNFFDISLIPYHSLTLIQLQPVGFFFPVFFKYINLV